MVLSGQLIEIPSLLQAVLEKMAQMDYTSGQMEAGYVETQVLGKSLKKKASSPSHPFGLRDIMSASMLMF